MPDSSPTSPGWIFISYRREETAYPAGWLYDRLADRFGASKIFKDIDSIELGDDFVEVITTAVGSCDVLLALIGNEWLTITGENGQRRLDDPADFVRVEIEAALARDVRVIPVLVDGASMPRPGALPASLTKLVRRQALELSPSRFDFDTGRLLRVLDRTLAEVQARVAATAPPPPVSRAPDETLPPPPSTPAPPEHTGEAPTPTIPPKVRSPGCRTTLGKQLGRLSTRTRIVAVEVALVALLLLIVAAVVNRNDSTAVEIPTGAHPFRIATTADGIWITNSEGTTVDRIDPDTNVVVAQVDLNGEPAGIDANPAGVWVSDFTNDTVDLINAAGEIMSFDVGDGPRSVSATKNAVWVANFYDNTVSHIDAPYSNSDAVQPSIAVGNGPRGIVATDDDVWVTNSEDGTVSHIDVAANAEVDVIPTWGYPTGVVLTADAVWVADASQSPGRVVQIDRATNTLGDPVAVGAHPGGMASTDDTVYVSNSDDDTVYAIDAATRTIDIFQTGRSPDGLAVTDTDLWVANSDDNTVSRIPLS